MAVKHQGGKEESTQNHARGQSTFWPDTLIVVLLVVCDALDNTGLVVLISLLTGEDTGLESLDTLPQVTHWESWWTRGQIQASDHQAKGSFYKPMLTKKRPPGIKSS